MKENKIEISYKVFESINELSEEHRSLLNIAKDITKNAYAPYSNFYVGAAAQLINGHIITGSNQENASFPVGLCAERILMASIASQHPGVPIEAIAITYNGRNHKSDHPVAPCGVCRQSLQEYEDRMKHPIQLILGGATGEIYVLENAADLLPFAFGSSELNNAE